MNEDEVRDWIALSLAPTVGPARFWELLARHGTPAAALRARPRSLPTVDGDGLRRQADDILARLDRLGGRAVTGRERDYPSLLREIPQPPPVFYAIGTTALLDRPGVAVVGSRAATSYGRRTSFQLGCDLAGSGIVVVSGVALGIDAAAHRGCLAAGGITVGVLGCGLDVVYPRGHRRLFEEISERGVLVSEYPPGTKPEPFRFPARNRIIAGLSRGVVVVEAARRSGAMITVQHALEQGREVFCVPGQVDSVKSGGTHWLLQQGASLVVSGADVTDQLFPPGRGGGVRAKPADATAPPLDDEAAALLALVEPYAQPREELLQRSGLSAARFSQLLLPLELAGWVELLPGDELRRLPR